MAASSSTAAREVTASPGQRKAMDNRSQEWTDKWTAIHDAYMLIWHSQLQESAAILGDTWKRNIWSAIGVTEVGLWEYNFGESKQVAKDLLDKIDNLEKISDAAVDKFKPSFFGPPAGEKQLASYLEALVGLAYAHLARAMYHFRRQSFVKGGYNLRKAWVTLKDAFDVLKQQETSNFAPDLEVTGCVNFGVGFFNFLVSLVPPSLQFLVKLLGFEGDRRAALTQLTIAVESRCCKRIEATFCLFGLRRYFTDDESAADVLLDELLEDYPDSPMVLYLCALMFRFKAQTDRSLHMLQHAVESVSHVQMKATLNYHLATTYVMTAQYEKALEHHKTFRDETSGAQFKVWSAFQSGICHWIMTGDKNLVVPFFQFVLEKGKSDVPLEKMAMRKAKEFFKNGEQFSDFNTKLARVQHIHEGQLWEEVTKQVRELLRPLATTQEEKAVCDYYRASALFGLKKHQKAHKYYVRVLLAEAHVKQDNYTYIVPYTLAELGETELELGNLTKAKEYLKKAKKYEDYDWNNLLSVRISASMDKLARREERAKTEVDTLETPAPVAETAAPAASSSSS